jgi:hypothetical protein
MKKFFAILALIAVSLTACDKGDKAEETTAATSAIKLSTDYVEFGKKGGEQSVLFTIENPTGGKVTAETNVEWLDAVIDFNEKVIITAEANDGEPRDAKVTIKYSSAKDATITVEQKGSSAGEYDVEFDANRFEGIYFGNSASTTYNYYVIISDIGATINGEPKANGTYYFFDFYSKVAGDSEYPILPNGTYTFDTKNSMGDATFTNEASWYAVMDEKGDYNFRKKLRRRLEGSRGYLRRRSQSKALRAAMILVAEFALVAAFWVMLFLPGTYNGRMQGMAGQGGQAAADRAQTEEWQEEETPADRG